MKKIIMLGALYVLPVLSVQGGITYDDTITRIDTLRGMYIGYQSEISQIESIPSHEQAEKFRELKENIERARSKMQNVAMAEEAEVTKARQRIYNETLRYIENKLSSIK